MRGTLEVVRQTSLNEEKITKNGQTYDVHVVVKNSPFQLVCRVRGASVNFNKFSHELKLMYDMEEEKEVSYVKQKPVEYKPTISEDGAQMSFEAIKIKVLSSHHEDNFFRLRLNIWDPNNDTIAYTVRSHPIKVISKPLKHRSKRSNSTTAGNQANNSILGFANRNNDDESSPDSSPRVNSGLKRSHIEANNNNNTNNNANNNNNASNDFLIQNNSRAGFSSPSFPRAANIPQPTLSINDISNSLVTKLSQVQEEQRRTNEELKSLREILQQQTDLDALFGPATKRIKRNTDDPKDIQGLFSELLNAFSLMDSTEALERVRDMLRTMSARDASQLVELVDILSVAGLNDTHKALYPMNNAPFVYAPSYEMTNPNNTGLLNGPSSSSHTHSAACAAGQCPQKMEMNRMDMFYNEVFFDGI